ncbi:guanine nucleotide-binding protein G(f) subunit alpha-like [Limulus polyphemus]|uniref:Guanine nucleotide-binding protein G(F) subunit alpha-like n=1 Tax=Limulus polyphemus TaxID=6850 RepID=A0ABM1SNA6_LIMPO|nr:guanine nucleotide-binding protein G(f) subunit alpha-like [Limulus polyphemus]
MTFTIIMLDCGIYFLDKVDEVRNPDYKPSDQDILCCRKRTCDIQKIEFEVEIPKKYGGGTQMFWMFDVGGQRGERRKWIQVFDGITAILFLISSFYTIVRMFDVGGQRGERRKWIQVFDGITAILFLISSSGFNLKVREDTDKNQLKESIELFQDVWSSRFLRECGFIIFFNKQDLLKEKIASGTKIAKYFPEFDTYNLSIQDRDSEEDPEYNMARCFIRDKFMEITRKPQTNIRLSTTEIYYDFNREAKNRKCYWHFTTATDTENVKRVFKDIHHMIIMSNIQAITPS